MTVYDRPPKPANVPYSLWLQGLTDLQLVGLIADLDREYERLLEETGQCVDTVGDVFQVLADRHALGVQGEVLARRFEMWFGDEAAQEDHEQQLELQAKARQLLRDWKDGLL